MNLHMERRLEVLAKEIAAKNQPRVDAAANAAFDAIGRKHEGKTSNDWLNGKLAEKKVRTVEDVLSDPTDAERNYIMTLRGGCGCSWPNAAPPCNRCTDEYTYAEAAEALEETRAD